jgi:outer membrane protein assembly factor BamB
LGRINLGSRQKSFLHSILALNSIRATDGKFTWRVELTGANISADAQIFSPPAIGAKYFYLSSVLGHVMSIRQSDGQVGRLYMFKHPVTFQPALARGNLYVGTADGYLICLRLGDADVEGWYAWGGNAQHNKIGL